MDNVIAPLIENAQKALEGTRTWLADAARPNGRFERDALTYRGLFKAPLGFAAAGLCVEGVRAVNILKERFMQPDGDFRDPPDVPADPHPAPSLRYFYPYRTAYIAMGAQRLGRYDVARRTGSFLLSLQSGESGGFAAALDASRTRFHVCGTAQGALAALTLGQWASALKAGRFLAKAFERQGANSQRFYMVLDQDVRLVPDWPRDPGYCYLVMGEPGQYSYCTALASGVLATLHKVYPDEGFLCAAQGYHDVTRRTHPDAFTNAACGKLAWASALLWSITGERRFLDDALRCTSSMCNVIFADRPMHVASMYPDFERQPAPFTFEVVFEYAWWLSEVLKELGVSGRRRKASLA